MTQTGNRRCDAYRWARLRVGSHKQGPGLNSPVGETCGCLVACQDLTAEALLARDRLWSRQELIQALRRNGLCAEDFSLVLLMRKVLADPVQPTPYLFACSSGGWLSCLWVQNDLYSHFRVGVLILAKEHRLS